MTQVSNMNAKRLQLFAWRADRRFLFIATGGGTYDLVKDQPVSVETLATLHREYQLLSEAADQRRKLDAFSNPPSRSDVNTQVRTLGKLVSHLVLHPDIRALVGQQDLSSVTISTNEFTIPWEIASVGDSFLGLKCPVTRRVHSSRPIPQRANVVFRHRLRVLLVSDPTGDLPASGTEVQEIQNILSSTPAHFQVEKLVYTECTRLRVLPLLAESDIFHYAGHAHFDPTQAEQPGLLLNDGPLLASELQNYLGEAGPMLVFLNACESGAFIGAEVDIGSQQMASLAHPFIVCGCSAFIGSSLPVGDIQAAKFATTVYEHLAEGEALAASTWKARRIVADEFGIGDPTWGSFLLFGDGDLRVVLTEEAEPPRSSEVRAALHTAIQWLRSERAENGFWCDRVYRQQAPNNAAEVILAFNSAHELMTEDEWRDTVACVLEAEAVNYSAAPYEPASLGPFTSCVAYVLQALIVAQQRPIAELRDRIALAIDQCVRRLLDMQLETGGWSWGEPRNGVGPYTLFTIEALDALNALSSPAPRVQKAIEVAYSYLVSIQRSDGGWNFKGADAASDPSSTCYVLCSLVTRDFSLDSPPVVNALTFLRARLNLADLTESQFFIDHRIEVPARPRSSWAHFEDYSGIAALCQLLIWAPEAERSLSTSGLRYKLIRQLVSCQEEGRGWPSIYSTIYATNYYINVLSSAADALTTEEAALKSEGTS